MSEKTLGVVGFRHKGTYDSSVTYKKQNIVTYDGSSYVALIDSPVGTPTDDGTNWSLFARGVVRNDLDHNLATDTKGLAGTVGAEVNAQTLVDDIAERVVDAKDVTVSFTSADNTSDPAYTAVDLIATGETEASLMNKMSQMAQNQRAIKDNLSHENLLDNPWFTVNQRGQTSYSITYGFTVDRWKSQNDELTVTVSDDGIQLTNSSNTDTRYLLQTLDIDFDFLAGKTLTSSLMMSDGTIYSKTFVAPTSIPTSDKGNSLDTSFGSFSATFKSTGVIDYRIRCNASTTSDYIRACKLELGSVSTLANDVAPNYQQELAKCQRFYQKISGSTNIPIDVGPANSTTTIIPILHLAVPFRSTPTLTYSITSIKVYGNGSVQDFSPTSVVLAKHILNLAYVRLTITSGSAIFTANQLYAPQIVNSTDYIELSADL